MHRPKGASAGERQGRPAGQASDFCRPGIHLLASDGSQPIALPVIRIGCGNEPFRNLLQSADLPRAVSSHTVLALSSRLTGYGTAYLHGPAVAGNCVIAHPIPFGCRLPD